MCVAIEEMKKESRQEGVREGMREGRLEGQIDGKIEAYNDCNMPVSEIAKKVSESEEYVKEVIKRLSVACL